MFTVQVGNRSLLCTISTGQLQEVSYPRSTHKPERVLPSQHHQHRAKSVDQRAITERREVPWGHRQDTPVRDRHRDCLCDVQQSSDDCILKLCITPLLTASSLSSSSTADTIKRPNELISIFISHFCVYCAFFHRSLFLFVFDLHW